MTPTLVTGSENGGDLSARKTMQEPATPVTFLLLPSEIRRFIFQILFRNLKVKLHKRDQSNGQYLCSVMRVCRLCYAESVVVFYHSVNISLHHESLLFVLRSRIGNENMARLHQLSIGGYDSTIPSWMALHLPRSLQKLYLRWSRRTTDWIVCPLGFLDYEDICRKLDRTLRIGFESCARTLWERNPGLQIFVDASITCVEIPVRIWNFKSLFQLQIC